MKIGNEARHHSCGAGGSIRSRRVAGVCAISIKSGGSTVRRNISVSSRCARRRSARPRRRHAPQRRRKPQPQAQAARPQRNEPFVMPKGPCFSKEGNADALIAACAAVIEAAKDKPQAMAVAYAHRGEAYREKGELDKAMADLDEALSSIRRTPARSTVAASSYRSKGEHDNAIAGFRSGDQARSEERRDDLQQPQPRQLREARLRARHPGPEPGDPAQSALHAGDLQSRHGLSRQGRAGARRSGLRPGAQDQSERRATRSTTAVWRIAICATTTARSRISIRPSRSIRI